jgi:hypothetical protein
MIQDFAIIASRRHLAQKLMAQMLNALPVSGPDCKDRSVRTTFAARLPDTKSADASPLFFVKTARRIFVVGHQRVKSSAAHSVDSIIGHASNCIPTSAFTIHIRIRLTDARALCLDPVTTGATLVACRWPRFECGGVVGAVPQAGELSMQEFARLRR